jgi:hypothetical protein
MDAMPNAIATPIVDRETPHALGLDHPLLRGYRAYRDLLPGTAWPAPEALTAFLHRIDDEATSRMRFAAQSAALLADGLHYEQRIAERGIIATRERNWHDLFNALVWLRHPALKRALNARQAADITEVGPKIRTRGQCAMTHFDEAGAIVWFADESLLALWDVHDWPGLFLRERAAWGTRIAITVFGHALLERQFAGSDALSTAKTIAVRVRADDIAARRGGEASVIADWAEAEALIAAAIRRNQLLVDPQEMRPLPLAGIPGWREGNANDAFVREAPCFRPLREGRRYPAPMDLRGIGLHAAGFPPGTFR